MTALNRHVTQHGVLAIETLNKGLAVSKTKHHRAQRQS
jgi:hypothetical protein